jgi:hypothetical protein
MLVIKCGRERVVWYDRLRGRKEGVFIQQLTTESMPLAFHYFAMAQLILSKNHEGRTKELLSWAFAIIVGQYGM